MRSAIALAALALLQVGPANAAAGKPAKSTIAHHWTNTVIATADGGFRMGNPAAKVKLIEYGSLTCPHCRAFDETGVPELIEKYVKTGSVSWEFRNFVRDPFDLSASLVARCNGASGFFPLMRGFYKEQPTWLAKLENTPRSQLEPLQDLPPKREFVEVAKIAGFPQWAASRGVPLAKSTQCLANEKSIDQLVKMTAAATSQYPDFQGTPSFVLNGTLVKFEAGGGSAWDQLKVAIDTALKR